MCKITTLIYANESIGEDIQRKPTVESKEMIKSLVQLREFVLRKGTVNKEECDNGLL